MGGTARAVSTGETRQPIPPNPSLLRSVANAALYTLAMFLTYVVVIAAVELVVFGGAQLADIRRVLVITVALAALFLLQRVAQR